MSSIARPVARSVSRSVLAGQGVDLGYLIRSMFANSEQGVAYDPNDLSTMWQDQAKLLPVTGEGQPVWHILDKSGNNNHAFATSSATRPILRKNATTGAYYLVFDGSDDFLVTSSIDFTATDEVSVLAGIKRGLGNAGNVIVELSASPTNNGVFLVNSDDVSGTGRIFARSKGTLEGNVEKAVANSNVVLSLRSKISTDTTLLKVNNTTHSSSQDQGTGNYGNYPLYIGRRAGTTLPFNGHIYSLIGVGRLTTES